MIRVSIDDGAPFHAAEVGGQFMEDVSRITVTRKPGERTWTVVVDFREEYDVDGIGPKRHPRSVEPDRNHVGEGMPTR